MNRWPSGWRRALLVALTASLPGLAAALPSALPAPGTAPSAHASSVAIIALDSDPNTPGIQTTASYPVGTSEITIDVVIVNAVEVAAFEAEVVYDITRLEFLGWSVGPFLGSTGRTVQCNEILTENSVRIGCVTPGQEPAAASGDGVLAKLRFEPRLAGETCFFVSLVETASIFGTPLPISSQGSCIVLVPDTPTRTPNATRTPTMTKTPRPTLTSVPTQPAPSSTVPPAPSATARRSPTRVSTVSPGTPAPKPSPTVAPPTIRCPLSAAFWREHPEVWPLDEMALGDIPYDKAALLELLAPGATDPSLILARALIAARLNVAIHVDATSIFADIVRADRALARFNARLPLGIDRMSPMGLEMRAMASRLDAFNRTCEGLRSDTLPGVAATPTPAPDDLPPTGSGAVSNAQVRFMLAAMVLLVLALLVILARQLVYDRRRHES